MATLVTAAILTLTLYDVSSACSWTVTDDTGNQVTLDLSCLNQQSLTTTDGDHSYEWSVCTDGQSCSGQNVMVSQFTADGAQCYVLGMWDQTLSPQYNSDNGGTWEFTYANGGDCDGNIRTWTPTFVCDQSSEHSIDAVQEQGNSCIYTVNVRTKYACLGQSYSCSDSAGSGLSGGWVFIIILLSALFLYCTVGYLVMGLAVNKEGGLGDFSNNIPQKEFWMIFPSLVVAGCSVTKEFVVGLVRKENAAGDALIEDDE